MKLLIAVDSAISAEVLVGAVGVRPWPDGTTARVLSVVADADVPEEVATGVMLSGNAKEVILDEAQKWAADLIVVGSHGRRGFRRLLLGSVSEAVAMNAHCSVVVVRGPARPQERVGHQVKALRLTRKQ